MPLAVAFVTLRRRPGQKGSRILFPEGPAGCYAEKVPGTFLPRQSCFAFTQLSAVLCAPLSRRAGIAARRDRGSPAGRCRLPLPRVTPFSAVRVVAVRSALAVKPICYGRAFRNGHAPDSHRGLVMGRRGKKIPPRTFYNPLSCRDLAPTPPPLYPVNDLTFARCYTMAVAWEAVCGGSPPEVSSVLALSV